MFYVGQEVVCIDDNWWDRDGVPPQTYSLPQKDRVYHVRAVINREDGEGTYLLLEEIVNPEDEEYTETEFHSDYFRPIKKTDISIFTDILKQVEEKVKAG